MTWPDYNLHFWNQCDRLFPSSVLVVRSAKEVRFIFPTEKRSMNARMSIVGFGSFRKVKESLYRSDATKSIIGKERRLHFDINYGTHPLRPAVEDVGYFDDTVFSIPGKTLIGKSSRNHPSLCRLITRRFPVEPHAHRALFRDLSQQEGNSDGYQRIRHYKCENYYEMKGMHQYCIKKLENGCFTGYEERRLR